MQLQYPMLAKVEVEMTQEKEMDELPNRPSKFGLPYLPTCLSKFIYDSILSIQLRQVLYYIKLKKGRLTKEVGTGFFWNNY